jgi:hypothetical protein
MQLGQDRDIEAFVRRRPMDVMLFGIYSIIMQFVGVALLVKEQNYYIFIITTATTLMVGYVLFREDFFKKFWGK